MKKNLIEVKNLEKYFETSAGLFSRKKSLFWVSSLQSKFAIDTANPDEKIVDLLEFWKLEKVVGNLCPFALWNFKNSLIHWS